MAKKSTSCTENSENMNQVTQVELSLLMDSILVYSPPQIILAPIKSPELPDQILDGFELEPKISRNRSNSFAYKGKKKYIAKLTKRRASFDINCQGKELKEKNFTSF